MKEHERFDLLAVKEFEGQLTAKSPNSKERQIYVKKGSYAEKLLQAGIGIPPRMYVLLVVMGSLLVGYIASFLGAFLSIFIIIVMGQYLLVGYLDDRAEKRKRIVIPQLPVFIDGLASALGTGFNIEGAIIQATQSVPEGLLRTELDRVVNCLNRGFSVNDSIAVIKQRIRGKEIISLSVALNLFATMGGTLLEPFRRLAAKIREQQTVVERANRDLVQVKQAFMILGGLSVLAPVVLSLLEPDYLKESFNDTLGRLILQIAVMMQIISVMAFKYITSLRL